MGHMGQKWVHRVDQNVYDGQYHVHAAFPPALSFSVRVKGRRRTHTWMRLWRPEARNGVILETPQVGETRGEWESDTKTEIVPSGSGQLQTAQRAHTATLREPRDGTVVPSTS